MLGVQESSGGLLIGAAKNTASKSRRKAAPTYEIQFYEL